MDEMRRSGAIEGHRPNDFRLNAIVFQEQADAGCKTVIEKFEHYAGTCSHAIAVFTPDDEVSAGESPICRHDQT